MQMVTGNATTVNPGRILINMEQVPQADGTRRDEAPYTISRLFSEAESNAKLALSADDDRYLTIGLSLAPAHAAGLGINLCPKASNVCRSICLFGTGHARVAPNVRRARVAKSRLWVRDPATFKTMMVREIRRFLARAERQGQTLVVRLNVFSDIAWERKFPELFGMFPTVQFYDYTKIASRVGKTPSNYHLTFSRSEDNEPAALAFLEAGQSVAVVFEDHSFPTTWHGYPVVDGTLSDLRILDPRGVVVALAEKDTEMHGPKYNGKRNAAQDTRGFVLPTATSNVHAQELVTA